jgi:hypothetical protein
VRGEDLTFFADGTNLTVVDPISRIPPHGGIMLLDFVGQIRDACHQIEMHGSEVLSRELAPSFFLRPKQFPARHEGGVPDAIYRGGVRSGIAAGSSRVK